MCLSKYFTLSLACAGLLVGFAPQANAQVLYDDWRAGHAWPGIEDSEPKADPDKDGIDNLIEYAFGSDPLFVGHGNLSYLPAIIQDSAGQPVFRFYRNTAFADIDYIVEESADLKNWTVVSGTLIETIARSGTWETCIVRVPSGDKARFYQVRVNYNPSTEPGREPYDPSEGIGTVITPNPFFPEADSRIPRGESITPGTPSIPTYTAVINNTKSTLTQSVTMPKPALATGYALGTETYRHISGGSAKIGNYQIEVPANSDMPFNILQWDNVLERDKIYPITLTNINGADWDFHIDPANFHPAWTSYEKTIRSTRPKRDVSQRVSGSRAVLAHNRHGGRKRSLGGQSGGRGSQLR